MIITGPLPILEDADAVSKVPDYSVRMAEALKPRRAAFTATVTPAANILTAVGTLAPVGGATPTDDTLNNDFVTGGAGFLKFTTPGDYLITYLDVSAANPGNKQCFIRSAAGSGAPYGVDDVNGSYEANAIAFITASANEQVYFNLKCANAVSSTATIKVRRLLP